MTAKATKNSQNRPANGTNVAAELSAVPIPASSIMLKVPISGVRNTATMPTNMKALPKMVNTRNFIAEYSFRPVPQTEMSMNIGTNSNSQNRKKSNRSIEVNTPITAVCNNNSQAKYSLTLDPTRHDASTAQKPNSPVKATRGALSPSTARR